MSKTPDLSEQRYQLRQRNRELSILNTIAQALNRSLDLSEILSVSMNQVGELFDLHTGWVWLLNEDSGDTYLAAAENLPPGLKANPELMRGSCYCLDTYRSGDLEGAANVNVVTCSRLKKLVDGTDGLRYHASIPLYAHGKQLGVLNLASPDWRRLTPDDLRLLYTVGDMLSIAIERARLFARQAEIGAIEERNRLAREIHDTLAQGLSGIALQLETAEALAENSADPEVVSKVIHKALLLTRESLTEARRSVLDLRAAPLEGRSLVQALQTLCTQTTIESGLQIECDLDSATHPLSIRLESGLLRIAQEALHNVVTHAHARSVYLQLVTTQDSVQLIIEDDGVGFDPRGISGDRFGLQGLNERARLLGGNLEIKSTPGQGTRVQVVVPND